jgi:hypothetical protein
MLAEAFWNEDTLAVALIFGVPIVSVVVSVLASYWFKIERVRSENDLKQSMIERGMSVEEIERVIAAKPSKD